MYRPIFAACLLLSASLFCQNSLPHPSLIPYRAGKLWGYARPDGAIAIKPQFSEATLFSRQLPRLHNKAQMPGQEEISLYPQFDLPVAQVRLGDRYGLLKESGEFMIPPVSLYPLQFLPVDTARIWVAVSPEPIEGESAVSVLLLHKSGRILVPLEAGYSSFGLGDCPDNFPDDRYGNWSIQPDRYYCLPASFASDYIAVYKNGKQGFLHKDGSAAFEPVWISITLPRDGRALAAWYDTTSADIRFQWGLVGPGNRVLKTFPDGFRANPNAPYGPVPVVQDAEMGYVNSEGEWAFPARFGQANPFSKNGYAIVNHFSGAWEVIDTTGQKVLGLQGGDGCRPWGDGYYIREQDGLFYRYDRNFRKTGTLGFDDVPQAYTYHGKRYYYVCRQGVCGLIDDREQIVLPFQYNTMPVEVGYTRNGTTYSFFKTFDRLNGLSGMLDTAFHELVPCLFDNIDLSDDGEHFWVTTKSEKFGLYSSKGNVVIPPDYDELRQMQNPHFGFYSVRQGARYGTFNRDGSPKMPLIYSDPLPNYAFQAPFNVIRAAEGWHVFDSTGLLRARVPSDADNCWHVVQTDCDTCFTLYVQKGERRFTIDQTGKAHAPNAEYQVAFRQDSLIWVKQNSLDGVLQYPDLRVLVPCAFQYVQQAFGRFLVKKADWPGERLWDVATQTAIDPTVLFTAIGVPSEGLLAVNRNNCLYGFVDSAFSLVIPLRYQRAYAFSEGLACVRDTNGLWGYIDRQGNWAIEPAYSSATAFKEGTATVQSRVENGANFRTAVIDRQGKTLFAWQPQAGQPPIEIKGDSMYFELENYPLAGKHTLVDRRSWKVILENCDCIVNKGNGLFWIKNGQLQTNGSPLPEGLLRTERHPAAGVQFVSLCRQTAMQNLQGRTLVPFGAVSTATAYPEFQIAAIVSATPHGDETTRFYDLSGRFIQEFPGNEYEIMSDRFLIVTAPRGERELRNLQTGRVLVKSGPYYFSMDQTPAGLVKVSDWEGNLVGYSDAERCYFEE